MKFQPGDIVMLNARTSTHMNDDMRQAHEKSLFLEVLQANDSEGFTYSCHSKHFENTTSSYDLGKKCWSYYGSDLSFWKREDKEAIQLLKEGHITPEQFFQMRVATSAEKEVQEHEESL